MGWVSTTIARATAAGLGLFTCTNILGSSWGIDSNSLWIGLRGWPLWVQNILLVASAASLLGFAARPAGQGPRRTLTFSLAAGLGFLCLGDAWTVLGLFREGTLRSGVPIPLSLAYAAALFLVAAAARRPASEAPRGAGTLVALGTVATLCVAFPLAQMLVFGRTDYRRPADAVVVLGSRVFADGRLSDALADRMRTGVELIEEGYAQTLIVSGGPGDGDVHETQAMREFAVAAGVGPGQIVLDPTGWSTWATVEGTLPLLARTGSRRVLVVSHAYHLPRIKLTYRRAGLEVWTVPARESYTLSRMPYFMVREVAAFWAYWARSLVA